MRIAQLANFYGPSSGGLRVAVESLAAGYVAAGYERLLVVPGPVDRRFSSPFGDVVQLRSPCIPGGYRMIAEPWRVTEVLARFRPTHLEISDKWTLVPVTSWARRRNVPSVLFSHERLDAMLPMYAGRQARGRVPITLYNRWLTRSFDAVVVTSRYAEGEFATMPSAARSRVFRVPLGVDLDTFRPLPSPQPSGAPIRLVHAGRLSREKSPLLAIETAMALDRRGIGVRLDLYGDGPQRRELERLAAGSPVFFHGYVRDRLELSRLMAQADVALSVCPGETFGLAVLEALASGTPVVTAAVGGARELVDEESGCWADPDPESLADAVVEVLSRPEQSRREAARRRAENYSWDRSIEGMLAVHRQVAGLPSLSAELA